MKQRILIIGSGFAGMWSAISAARLASLQGNTSLEIAVMAPEPVLYVRPRFYEANVSNLTANLQPLFAELNIRFIAGYAERIDDPKKGVWYSTRSKESSFISYDKLIIASGSHLHTPEIKGFSEYGFDIDRLESASRLEDHLNMLAKQPETPARNTVVVCGGGFTGIELATELPSRLKALFGKSTNTRVIVIERAPVIGNRYSQELRDIISRASAELGIEWYLNAAVEMIDKSSVLLQDGTRIESATVVWTAGVTASPPGERLVAERDASGRFFVTKELQIPGYSDIFAAGDMANAKTDDDGNTTLMSCQHAIQLGKFAGYNAAACMMGLETLPYQQVNYVTCLDLGAWGAVYTEGWEQQVKLVKEDAKKLKTSITKELIYPPEADRNIAFAAADPLAKFV
ncbi:TPA: FAD-dependent oxidoreductase [Escherichia albertii]|uniref:NAD(P)/FAD-dependent oxidoreductase n=1 Tax=Escherichia albertii TaxID=208962 RepID=UPI0007435C82|nr:FAD-dependent oxidoreductase [Escherichia albertii]EEX4923822.1 FAD-dependent oxidoreductase [Escherichia albertii]MCZ9075087.1 FAD-dependent oxidoreductase [Escherichia albertii]MCZ9122159.1 FAD-dependent oxidoreductase [Escherichia albertii]